MRQEGVIPVPAVLKSQTVGSGSNNMKNVVRRGRGKMR